MSTYKKSYNPNRNANWNYGGKNWKLSRSKIDLFIECPRCFYIDNKLGTARPRGPSFTLNIAVDLLFKKEFDVHRKNKTRHPIMEQNEIEAIPFAHPEMDTWRENFEGIQFVHKETGFTVSGAVDDVWQNQQNELIVVDYKATSKQGRIETLSDSAWEDQYKRQMGVYQWLLKQNGFDVSTMGYFVYANASSEVDAFNDTLEFETTLVPCEGTTEWIEPVLEKIKICLDSEVYPEKTDACEFCMYREVTGRKLQDIHRNQNAK